MDLFDITIVFLQFFVLSFDKRFLTISTTISFTLLIDTMANKSKERATKKSPWQLKTAPGTSDYEMYKDEKMGNKF
jgi:hypothetical protein